MFNKVDGIESIYQFPLTSLVLTDVMLKCGIIITTYFSDKIHFYYYLKSISSLAVQKAPRFPTTSPQLAVRMTLPPKLKL